MVIHSGTATIDSPQMRQAIDRVSAVFAGDTRFGSVIAPQPGISISPDGHTGIVVAGANASTDDMVRAVDEHAPAPAVRTMAVGIMSAVVFVLAATLTLLPAALGALGPRIDAAALPFAPRQPHRSPRFARWGEVLQAHPWPFAVAAVAVLVALAVPVLGLRTAVPSIEVVPADAPVRQGYELVQRQMGVGAPGAVPIVAPAAEAEQSARTARDNAGIVAVFFTFALADPLPPKEMGIILGVAVLLDAALVRLVLLPVLLRLTGHRAWWAPAWLRWVLPTISFAHD